MATLGTFLILLAESGRTCRLILVPPSLFSFRIFGALAHSLDEVRDHKLVVLAFLGVECPLANQYAPKLVELARALKPKGVAFFGIDANQQDGVTAMGRFSNENGLPFPFLKDVGNELADLLKVERTPEVIVLDAKRDPIPGSHG